MADDGIVLIFVKSPERGMVKSRLASTIGKKRARALYDCFVLDMVETLRRGAYPAKVFYYPAKSGPALKQWLGKDLDYAAQKGNDLGERMKNAFVLAFSEGREKVVLIGSDIPDLKNQLIEEAFQALDGSDAVIGPASDGGYYLIGFKENAFLPDIFKDILWGGESVFEETMAIFRSSGCNVHVLPEWRDIDTAEDLHALFEGNAVTDFRKSRTMSYIVKNKDKILL